MRVHDTLGGAKQTISADPVRIYLCGVTVYDEAHVGHARTVIVFDVLRRYLEDAGVSVRLVQNFTDVDDKIIDRARQEGVAADQLSARYIGRYHDDFDRLGVARATAYPQATEHIPDMLELIADLIKKGSAYIADNGVYFAVGSFAEYGMLSKKKTDELEAGARIEVDKSKKNPLDFALWKFADDEPSWDSPWGRGRPGWHIECSAMSLKYLGDGFEIHGGGRDLIFPHHENEIAQSEAHTGKQFAKVWMHVGMVTIDGQKMSKSLHNIKTVSQALSDWGPNVIRLFCLSGHYSKPVDYAGDIMAECVQRWRQIEECHYELLQAADAAGADAEAMVSEARRSFDSAMDDDLNTHLAQTVLLKLTRDIVELAATGTLSEKTAGIVRPEFDRMLGILGLSLPDIGAEQRGVIDGQIRARDEHRSAKRFAEADRIRDELARDGIELSDHQNRTVWIKRESIKSG